MTSTNEFPVTRPVIALMGEFSAGKSTLANLLLGEGRSPVQVTATQLPPVWFSYGSEAPYKVDLDGNEDPNALFPQDLRGFEGRADWIVLITNDAWFGDLAMPQSHLDHARMRAIETGLPMIRAANTGISAMIDARGRIVEALPLDTPGTVLASLPPAIGPTLYNRFEDRIVISFVLIVSCLSSLIGRRSW